MFLGYMVVVMTEKLDYRVIQVECTFKFDYMEKKPFEEFSLALKKLCEKQDIRISKFLKTEDILFCEVKE